MVDVKFAHLYFINTIFTLTSKNTMIILLLTYFVKTKTFAITIKIICNSLLSKIFCITILLIEYLEIKKPAYAYEVDLLVAIKIQNWVFRKINTNINVLNILNRTLISILGRNIAA